MARPEVPALRYARTSDGVRIAHQVVGAGPSLVWLPSLGSLLPQWRVPWMRRTYEALASSQTLVLYDGRGMGSSDRGVDLSDLGVEAHVRDLESVLPPGRVSLLAQYHAVPTAIAFAAAHPERVEHLVLFGGAARLRDVMHPTQTQALLSLVEQDWELFTDSAAQAWLGWEPERSGREVAEVFRAATTPATARAWFAAAAEIDVTPLLATVQARTLVLHRQSDRQMPREVSVRLAATLPRGELVTLAGERPTLFLEDPDGDLAVVQKFLGVRPATSREHLTARERDVLQQIAAGGTNADVARALGISEHTVERHASALYRKIGARGRADATAWALRHLTGFRHRG